LILRNNNSADDYEDVFFAALVVILKTAVGAGIDRDVLADRLQTAADGARADRRLSKAAYLELVATMADPNRCHAPKPILHVVRRVGDDDVSN
jgi:hypothetical protein